ncbi:SLC13 family permease [Polycyclovorans algicola]|uniref:SLC13 family permease n=1 Tax=Polycyclovorans algicola TaxID=616992 RepID=UPI000693D9FC|nr:SLC13 family permease [Polycyclovorans algicola]
MSAWLIASVFVFTYLGMAAGRVPGLKVDRAHIAFAASVLLLVSGSVTLKQAGGWLDWDALLLLLGMMIISVQFQLSGVYARVNVGVGRLSRRPKTLLALVTVLG